MGTGKYDRRQLLNWGLFIGLAVLGPLACKSDTPAGPEPPVSVTLQFDVYNHTKGFRTSFARTVMSGENVVINAGELGVAGVDQQRIAIRQDNFGNLVVYSGTGQCGITAPIHNTGYDIILFNASNNAPYQWMDDLNSHLYKDNRDYIVYRKDFDSQTGPEDVWASVFDQLNSALDLGFVKWGYINRQPRGASGDFCYGYGNSNGNIGWHQGSWITINPKQCSNELVMTMVGLEEAFENICQVDNIGGTSSLATIQTGGVLNPVGKDLFAYVFARDSASKSSGSSAKISFGYR
jgi:hypothetical protein